MSDETIFQRIGGENAIMSAVTLFYEKVMSNPDLAQFFDGMAMDAQIQKQLAFMMMAFGGPHEHTGRDMTTAHANLVKRGLNDQHFDKIGACLKEALEELGVAADIIDGALEIVEGT